MKRFTFLSLFTALIFASAMIMSGCTKEGPAGPAGKDGTDGTAGCVQCHDDSEAIFAASVQWEASVHATGGNFERNNASCGACHTSQGFLQRIANGTMEADGTIENPTPINCYTCHNIHETYTPEDWAFTATEPVEFWINGDVVDMGRANLCAQCHQARVPNPMPVVGSTEEVEVTSVRYGPHHGPQGNLLAGSSVYEVPGSINYVNSMHTDIENGCVSCHMAEAYGAQAGGHTMGVGYDYHGHTEINEAGCVACHEGEDLTALVEEYKEETHALLTELKNMLITEGVLDSSGYAIPDTMPMHLAGAIYNYKFIEEDRSGGIHNPKYTKATLTNTIESLQ
ncbi:MAG: hypothetical protein U5Q03_15155 [Bacteroidota bacterium]|nr:hypothetical protein [Bacteroidota bacterium]